MAGSPRRCQGCGVAEGAQRTAKMTRHGKPVAIIARLEQIRLGDFGARLLCQACSRAAYALNTDFAKKHYACAPPDPSS
jgi:hypothetical protein